MRMHIKNENTYTQKEVYKILRSHQQWLNGKRGKRANFERMHLRGLDFSNVDLSYATFKYATLTDSNFSGAELFATDFSNSRLHRSIFTNIKDGDCSNFTQSSLKDTDMSYSSFEGSNFTWAFLENTKLKGAKLTNACFSSCDIFGADLSETKLYKANFENAEFDNTNIKGANFSQANMCGVTGLDVYSIINVETFNGMVTYIPSIGKVFTGCWEGSEQEFFDECLRVREGTSDECGLNVAEFMVKAAMIQFS